MQNYPLVEEFHTDIAAEAALQDQFAAHVFKQNPSVEHLNSNAQTNEGLSAYQNNGALNAARAMAVIFPAVFALLGEDDFNPLAQLHWRAHPPVKGDWGQYGSEFAHWIESNNPGNILDSLPFLPDLARFDWALSHCQDAGDATLDTRTLALLAEDASTVRIVLHPSVATLTLSYELTDFRQAALDQDALAAPVFSLQHLVLARKGWRAQAQAVDTASYAFIAACLKGNDLATSHALACSHDAEFDFAQWLSTALAAQWIVGVSSVA